MRKGGMVLYTTSVRWSLRWLPLVLLACGCGNTGGGEATAGEVLFDGLRVADLQVSVYAESGDCVATGMTDPRGRFTLLHPETVEPVSLHSGTFHLVVESVAADPIPVAKRFTSRASTPLVREWTEGPGELSVEVTSK